MRFRMANRKKYVEKLIKMEKMRKRRLKKKLKRQKRLAGLRKDQMNRAGRELKENQSYLPTT